ncbi:putative zinc-RING and/or ribbon domain-containing protein [Ditylenchus destructor]|nr:putative zinc-RING and/or ribbon domain-containing protein [Ditylenchus destructor]
MNDSVLSKPESSSGTDEVSDYENFMDSQLRELINEERKKQGDLCRADQLLIAIDFCKKFLVDSTSHERRRTEEVLAKLVELKLELEQLKDFPSTEQEMDPIKKVRGHEFLIQPSSSGRNPYCEVCLSTIWRLVMPWRRCKVCGFRTHDKCVEVVRRPCVSVRVARQQFPYELRICPEQTLPSQNYQCAECANPIGFDEGPQHEPRLCDYSGRYYCRNCHWNDLQVIPARLIKNWDVEKRPVCRASKQLLIVMERKPIIDLGKENPMLFKYINALARMKQMRTSILLMKAYFMCCRKARKMRILQHLHRYQHFVETDNFYTMGDLIQLANGKLLPEIEAIVSTFRKHITEDCEICKGNAFICELCDNKEVLYPFSEGVTMCKDCCAVFHQDCFKRVSKRCR